MGRPGRFDVAAQVDQNPGQRYVPSVKRGISLDAVAALAGVARPTVSKVLSPGRNAYRISSETRARVLAALSKLGYQAKTPASRRGRYRPVVALPALDHLPESTSIYGEVPGALCSRLAIHGIDTQLLIIEDWNDYRAQAARRQTDGLVLLEFMAGDLDNFQTHAQVPLVCLNLPTDLPVDQVCTDERAGALLGVDHLLDLGHRHLAFLHPIVARHVHSLTARRDAILDRCRDRGAICRVGNVIDVLLQPAPDAGHGPVPTAVISYHEQEIPQLLDALRRREIHVPRQMSVLCLGGAPAVRWSVPAITAVEVPIVAMTTAAADLIAERLHGGVTTPRRRLLDQRLLVRDSTAPPGSWAGNPRVP